jgi:hypothetical protein
VEESRALAPDPSLIGANDSRATVRATERATDVWRHAGQRSRDRKRNGHTRRALGTDDSGAARDKREGDPTVAPLPLRGIGALRCSESGGRRELGHPWPRTSTPFPAGFLRYSARHTGFARHAAVATRSLRPAPGRHREVALGLRASALRGHDGRVTGPLAGRRAAGGSARRVARTMRAIFAPAHGGAAAKTRKPIADPEAGCRRALGWGALSLGYFSLGKQREVTRDARRAARKLLMWLPILAQKHRGRAVASKLAPTPPVSPRARPAQAARASACMARKSAPTPRPASPSHSPGCHPDE